jgi:DNA (cytosine-5)-methyltransferase 1
MDSLTDQPLRVVSLFTGVAGLDFGLEQSGLEMVQMCESWLPAQRVLRAHFPKVPLADDVATFTPTTPFDVLSAGFPCTDLSHAGGKAGIFGKQSGLVSHVFRIAAETQPQWIALENVPNLLSLHNGAGMQFITRKLELLGYRWAYRTVDSRATGVPQRRPRVIILASLDHFPAKTLLDQEAAPASESVNLIESSGFYWTEGRNGLGLVPGAIPTLKGGSTLGLPSAPAVWIPGAKAGRRFVLPTIEDGEALQGMPRGWTKAAVVEGEVNLRWKLIGNAVTTGIGRWLGECINRLADETVKKDEPLALSSTTPIDRSKRWPGAGWGDSDSAWVSSASQWPIRLAPTALEDVVSTDSAPALSYRATAGFLARLDESRRTVPEKFYDDLEVHLAATRPALTKRRAAVGTGPELADARGTSAGGHKRPRDEPHEIRLRRAWQGSGLGGYRLQARPEPHLRIRKDIVFPGARVAVDIRNCFWHGCPAHPKHSKIDPERWADKIARTAARDVLDDTTLRETGWQIVVVWTHDDPVLAAKTIEQAVRLRRAGPSSQA